ncbi:hypothetical protein CA13_28300 [Planctomycetes bacterium CA13]|uniref:DUF7939 domain-containing protein n=1 Tax=Novipirellula herctigrandis TaxID=2527986 RepID=A0A5C5Z1X3_9BACT|nr:hypothetical protein CA13_28300 [Planctomycetes bacterium CA13]
MIARRTFCFALLLLVVLFCRSVAAIAPVRIKLGQETAWMGEAVTITVTLYSPGPFSGSPAFDLPEIPLTAIVKTGNPVVSSEQVEGETYLIQQHEFTLFTQQSGEIAIPPFRVRFEGKSSFLAKAEPVEGMTAEVKFQSKRPPDTESMAMVVTATKMQIEQSWEPSPEVSLKAGDAIVRSVNREAEGTTAMMLAPIADQSMQGVKVYLATPQLEDRVDRGDARAYRTDRVTYQFKESGEYTIPELSFTWWNPTEQRLEQKTLPSVTLSVTELPSVATVSDDSRSSESVRWTWVLGAVMFAVVAVWLLRKPVSRLVNHLRQRANRDVAIAERKLRSACNDGDAQAAYGAMLRWLRAKSNELSSDAKQPRDFELELSLDAEWRLLSQRVYGVAAERGSVEDWDGRKFWTVFSKRRPQTRRGDTSHGPPEFPPLNPSSQKFQTG